MVSPHQTFNWFSSEIDIFLSLSWIGFDRIRSNSNMEIALFRARVCVSNAVYYCYVRLSPTTKPGQSVAQTFNGRLRSVGLRCFCLHNKNDTHLWFSQRSRYIWKPEKLKLIKLPTDFRRQNERLSQVVWRSPKTNNQHVKSGKQANNSQQQQHQKWVSIRCEWKSPQKREDSHVNGVCIVYTQFHIDPLCVCECGCVFISQLLFIRAQNFLSLSMWCFRLLLMSHCVSSSTSLTGPRNGALFCESESESKPRIYACRPRRRRNESSWIDTVHTFSLSTFTIFRKRKDNVSAIIVRSTKEMMHNHQSFFSSYLFVSLRHSWECHWWAHWTNE